MRKHCLETFGQMPGRHGPMPQCRLDASNPSPLVQWLAHPCIPGSDSFFSLPPPPHRPSLHVTTRHWLSIPSAPCTNAFKEAICATMRTMADLHRRIGGSWTAHQGGARQFRVQCRVSRARAGGQLDKSCIKVASVLNKTSISKSY